MGNDIDHSFLKPVGLYLSIVYCIAMCYQLEIGYQRKRC